MEEQLMQTRQKRRQQSPGLNPYGGNPGSGGLGEMRASVRDITDVGDHALLEALSTTEQTMKDIPQQTGQ